MFGCCLSSVCLGIDNVWVFRQCMGVFRQCGDQFS